MPIIRHTFSLVIALVVLALYAVLNSSLFYAETLEWTGLVYLQEEELVKLSGFRPQNALRSDLRQLRTQLEEHAWVERANVEWRWPNRIIMHITERRPLAMIPIDESWFLLDSQGVLLPPPLGIAVYTLPLVTNIDIESPSELQATARLLSRIPSDLWESISEWNATKQVLITRQGTQVKIGEIRDLATKFQLLAAILDKLALQEEKASVINLEAPQNPVVIKE